MPSQTFTSSGTWVAPSNLAGAPKVEAWGEGGDGASALSGSHSGGGAGGGSYGAEPSLGGVTAGSTTLTITIGAGGTSTNTTVTGGSTTVTGNAGTNASATTHGNGGAASGNTVAFAGGNGGGGVASASRSGGGGGGSGSATTGGGAGGTGGAGGGGSAGTAGTGGGTGGAGGGINANGGNGVAPGGGGGGGGDGASHSGGNGAAGQVIITWSENISGTGTVALGPLHLAASGAEKFTGTGTLALGSLHLSGTNGITGTGHLALGPVALHGTATENFTGTGTLALGSLALSGSQETVIPGIPSEPAGIIAKAADLNDWSNASAFLSGSARGNRPVFYLMASTTQSLTTSFAAVNYSDTAAVFKDNNDGWDSGSPSRYTVFLAGYYTIEWSVSAATGAGHLQAYAQVTTSAANPFNPSTTFKFHTGNRAATTDDTVVSSGGLVPVYLAPGDYIEVYALVGTGVNTSATFPPQLSGEWVSQ